MWKMSEFVKLKKEWAPREEQHPRMFWVQSSVLRTIIVYYVWSYPGSEQRDIDIYIYIYFFFFNKYRSSFSPAQNLLRSELSSLWSHLPFPVHYPVLPLICLRHLGLLPVSWTEQICCYLQAFMLGVSSWNAEDFTLPFSVMEKPWGRFWGKEWH